VFGRLHFAGYDLGEMTLPNAIPALSDEGRNWIESRTGENNSFRNLGMLGPPWQTQYPTNGTALGNSLPHPDSIMDLPNRNVVDAHLFMYRSSVFHRMFPCIDLSQFQETIDLVYAAQPGPPSLEIVGAKACVLSFLALTSSQQLNHMSIPLVDINEYIVKAHYLLPQILHEATIVGLQTCCMLVSYHFMTLYLNLES
jgi:hypothetical protein